MPLKLIRSAAPSAAAEPATLCRRDADQGPASMRKPRVHQPSDHTDALRVRGTIDPGRLQTILHRLATGFYHRDEVLDQLADRIAPDLP